VKKFVIIAGNIGVGKSTLVRLLCQHLGWEPFFEPHAENPYLADFYADMRAWAFHSQIYFLTHRLQAHHQLLNHPTSVMQDRSVYEDAEVFAHNLYRQGWMNERDYQTYRELYEVLTRFLPPPDLVVYLRASTATLLHRISQRGRHYEQSITADYLRQLNELYEEWVASFCQCPVLAIPSDELDYVANPEHLELVVSKIQDKLTGKEEVIFNG
jgi:deoxyadenosine/deoxycytidine kinase